MVDVSVTATALATAAIELTSIVHQRHATHRGSQGTRSLLECVEVAVHGREIVLDITYDDGACFAADLTELILRQHPHPGATAQNSHVAMY